MKRIGILLIMIALIAGAAAYGVSGGGNGADAGNGADGGNGADLGELNTLTVDSTAGGTVTVDNVTIAGRSILTYDTETVVSLIATPDSGYQFVRWTRDVDTVDNVRAAQTAVAVNGDYFILAIFEIAPPVHYSLTIIGPAHGSVTTPGEGRFVYEEGTVVNLVAKPTSGYEFVKWTGDVTTIANVNAASTTITMDGNYYIYARFRDIPMVCGASSVTW
jgi:hypothetical protein